MMSSKYQLHFTVQLGKHIGPAVATRGFRLCTVWLLLLLTHTGRGQTLSLNQLLALSASTGGAEAPEARQHLPAERWSYRGVWQNTNEVYWTCLDIAEANDPDAEPVAWIGLRPNQAFTDVVYKTVLPTTVTALRGELRKRKLTPEPVNCIECEGARYSTPEFQLTIYSKKKGDFPFVVVVRRLLPAAGGSSLQAKALSKNEAPAGKVAP